MINPKIELDEKMINPKIELDEKMINPKIELNKPSKVSDFSKKKQGRETKVQTKPEMKQVQDALDSNLINPNIELYEKMINPNIQLNKPSKISVFPEKKQVEETKVQAKQTSNFIFSGMYFCLFLITIFFVSTWACESSNQSQCKNVETIAKDVVQYLGFQKKF
jgi:hypothetical protein